MAICNGNYSSEWPKSQLNEEKIECLCHSSIKLADFFIKTNDVYISHICKNKVKENLFEVSLLASTKNWPPHRLEKTIYDEKRPFYHFNTETFTHSSCSYQTHARPGYSVSSSYENCSATELKLFVASTEYCMSDFLTSPQPNSHLSNIPFMVRSKQLLHTIISFK
jgi:hypothetical protein